MVRFHCRTPRGVEVHKRTAKRCELREDNWYASIRKSQHKLRSVKLNAIAERELGDKKVEYPENTNILAFIYANWRLFAIYNIKDTLLQLGIERKTNDTLTYYIR